MHDGHKRETRSWRWLAFWSVFLLLAVWWQGRYLLEIVKPRPGLYADFSQDWLSAQNLVHGRPVYRDQEVAIRDYTPDRPDGLLRWNAHPPTSVLLFAPLTCLDCSRAHFAWNIISLAALGASLYLVVRIVGLRTPAAVVAASTLLLVGYPLHYQLFHGQLTAVLLLLVVGSWALDRTGRDLGAGFLLGAAATIKLFPAFLFLYFLARRRWRALVGGAMAVAGLTVLTGAVVGRDAYRTYATMVLPYVDGFRSSWANASLPGYWSRLFDPQPIGVDQVTPLWPAPALARVLGIASAAVLVVLTWPVFRHARTDDQKNGAFSLAILAMLLASPLCWFDYCLFLLLPVMWLWQQLAASRLQLVLVVFLVPIWFPLDMYEGTSMGPASIIRNERHVSLWESLTFVSLRNYALIGLFALIWVKMRITSREANP